MTAFQPGFMDDPRPPEPPPISAETLERPLDPGFIDTISAPPEALPMRVPLPLPAPGLGPVGWIAAGLGILVAGGSLLSLAGFVIDQMARSPALGWLSLATVSAGVLAVLWGIGREVRSYRRLTRVDGLRARLRPPGVAVEIARAECQAWLETVGDRLADPDGIRLAMNGCATTEEVRAMLAHRASQGAAMVAIIPSPALEGLAAGLRSLKLIREIASLYGLRPGLSVTVGLVRRAAVTAASVYGVNEIAGAAAAHFLADAPVLRSIASAAPGAGITARRIYLLARTVAEACSPL